MRRGVGVAVVLLGLLLAVVLENVAVVECEDDAGKLKSNDADLELLKELKESLKEAVDANVKSAKAKEEVTVEIEEDDDDDDDDWEDFEEDEEVTLSESARRVDRARAVKNYLFLVNDQNARTVLSSKEYVLLLGYAPWCKQSAAVMEELATAAADLEEVGSAVVLAKLDGTASPQFASRHHLKGYPTIYFFTNGSQQIYNGGHLRADFVNWIKKRTGLPATTVSSVSEAEKLQKKNDKLVIGLFEAFEGPEYDNFLATANEEDGAEFVQVLSVEVAKAFNVEMSGKPPALWLWKKEPEQLVTFAGELKRDAIAQFVDLNKHPLVTKLNSQTVTNFYNSPVKRQILLFATADDYEKIYPYYLAAAKTYKGQGAFAWLDIDDEPFTRPMLTMYAHSSSEPVVAGFDNSNGARYLLESEVTSASLEDFVFKFVIGELEPFYKSEPVPKKNKGDVKIVVGKTFEKIVLRSSKDVFLQVYTPWCISCESVDKVFQKVAKQFKNVSSLIFAKVDASANDIPFLKDVERYPALLFYPAGAKDSRPIRASSTKLKLLVEFVKMHATGPVIANKEENSVSKADSMEINAVLKDTKTDAKINSRIVEEARSQQASVKDEL